MAEDSSLQRLRECHPFVFWCGLGLGIVASQASLLAAILRLTVAPVSLASAHALALALTGPQWWVVARLPYLAMLCSTSGASLAILSTRAGVPRDPWLRKLLVLGCCICVAAETAPLLWMLLVDSAAAGGAR